MAPTSGYYNSSYLKEETETASGDAGRSLKKNPEDEKCR
jgi:hypothetical protein